MEKDGELGEAVVLFAAPHRLLHQRKQLGIEGFKVDSAHRRLAAAEVLVEVAVVEKAFEYWVVHDQPFTTRSVAPGARTTSDVGGVTVARASAGAAVGRWSPAWSVAEARIISQRFP